MGGTQFLDLSKTHSSTKAYCVLSISIHKNKYLYVWKDTEICAPVLII